MSYSKIKVEILRHPTDKDWERCKTLALATMGKKYVGNEITEEWKHKILKARHSPIRTLMFTIKMEVPYYVSTHFVRHKYGIEHYVQSQRNDRQSLYDRELAPQNAMVTHIIDVNAEELMNIASRRLCGKADANTRYAMFVICNEVEATNPEFKGHLVPMCENMHECPEFISCGYYNDVDPRMTQD